MPLVPDARVEVVRCVSYAEFDALIWVSKPWQSDVMREAADRLVHDKYSSSTLMAFINWAPGETLFDELLGRLANIARKAGDSDFDLRDETSFRTLVKISLALQHKFLAIDRPSRDALPLRLRHVVDLLVRSVARGWSSTHPVVQLVLKNLDFLPDDLEVEVGDKIQLMQKAWRRLSLIHI